VNTNYTLFAGIRSLGNVDFSSMQKAKLQILKSDLLGFIVDSSRMQAFSQEFSVQGKVKDPDY